MERRWILQKHDRNKVADFANDIGTVPIVAALLIARGFDTHEKADKFLSPSMSDLHEPFLLAGMRQAVDRIFSAIQKREKILIWGDYDVDGTTGTVVLRKALRLLGAETGFHIPNRFTEGYGINIPALQTAMTDGYSLVISVDCGTRSFEPLKWAVENGLDVIVTDHHLSDDTQPNPLTAAFVNPNQRDCQYPDKNLAGVGVAFKLAHALLRESGQENEIDGFLKIAAIGTIADIMQLSGENRAIVSLGLRDLTRTTNLGLKALMEVADCRSEMTSYHIGFRIAPRINAAGRMDIARHVVDLLESDSFNEARRLAELLDSRNRERQTVQQKITELAMFETENIDRQGFVVVAGEGWHRGVIGLAASRIAEYFHRPAIVLSVENGMAHGSARSIPNYHLLNALESCSDLFEQFGGHAAAAGLKISSEKIVELRERLNRHAVESIAADDLIPTLNIDALVSPQTLDLDLVEHISLFEPFGAGNPKPVFLTRGLYLVEEPRVMKEKHLKLRLADDSGRPFEAVWWDGVRRSQGQTLKPRSGIELAYVIEANKWQGNTRLQLVVEDLRADN